ncbi:toprim domain-containing protein [Candidatus Woesearchaeota archaeon]|nr:toprim domain-containing protein [Candidatus Woesearchaeota archaeon]
MLLDDIFELLEKLRREDIPLLAEGKKDQEAFWKLGFANIIMLEKRALYKVIEQLLNDDIKEIAILTDLDKEGKKLYHKLNDECSRKGIRVNNKLRHFLLKETPLTTMEGLPSYLETLEKKKYERRKK